MVRRTQSRARGSYHVILINHIIWVGLFGFSREGERTDVTSGLMWEYERNLTGEEKRGEEFFLERFLVGLNHLAKLRKGHPQILMND